MKIIINSFIDNYNVTTIADALARAKSKVITIDIANDNAGDVVTKLYYITPELNSIIIVTTVEDALVLGVDQVLANTSITLFPFANVPAQIIAYKELIVTAGSTISQADILDVAQLMANTLREEKAPYQVPVVKIINYNDDSTQLVMSGVFGPNIFLVGAGDNTTTVVNDGDPDNGSVVIEQAGAVAFTTIKEAYLSATPPVKVLVDGVVYLFDGTYYKTSANVVKRYQEIVNKDQETTLLFYSNQSYALDFKDDFANRTTNERHYGSGTKYFDVTYKGKTYSVNSYYRQYTNTGSSTLIMPRPVPSAAAIASGYSFHIFMGTRPAAAPYYTSSGVYSGSYTPVQNRDVYAVAKEVIEYTIPAGYTELNETQAYKMLPN